MSSHGQSIRMDLPSDPSSSATLGKLLLRRLAEIGVGDDTAMRIRLAAHEAVTNAVEHGNRWDFSKKIHVECILEPGRVEVSVEDEGDGYRPEDVPDPTLDENLLKSHGRGLLLIRDIMDEVRLSDSGTRITMVKHLK